MRCVFIIMFLGISSLLSGMEEKTLRLSSNSWRCSSQELNMMKVILELPILNYDGMRLYQVAQRFLEYRERYKDGPVEAAAYYRLAGIYWLADTLSPDDRGKYAYFIGNNKEKVEKYLMQAYAHERAAPYIKALSAIHLGYMCLERRLFELAKEYFACAHPELTGDLKAQALNGLGVAYYALGNKCSASVCWNNIIKGPLSCDTARAYYNFSWLFEESGQYAKALECLQHAKKHGFENDDEKEFTQRMQRLRLTLEKSL